jgi:glycosyltransferase involved in cell wall biosynthesis
MKKKKRIVIAFASVPFIRGGAEIMVESLQQELIKRGFQCEIVSLPFKWYPKEEILKSAFAWRLLDLSESNGQKIDMVIATKFPSYWIKHNKKVTWLVHQHRAVYDLYGTPYSDFNESSPEDRMLRKDVISTDNQVLSEAKELFTISQTTSKRLYSYNGIKAESLYHPPSLAGRYYHDDTGDYILSVGRLDPIKRIDLLIEAISRTKSNVKCIIAGKGSQEDALREIAKARGIIERVKFAGFVSDEELLELYANSLAVYYAPFDEDYGYVTLEAFLSKKTIITCDDSGGVLEFAENGVNSLITKPNPQEVADAIDKLFYDHNRVIQFGLNGYERVKGISWDNVINRLTETL